MALFLGYWNSAFTNIHGPNPKLAAFLITLIDLSLFFCLQIC